MDAGAWADDTTYYFGSELESNGNYVVKFSEVTANEAAVAIETGVSIATTEIDKIATTAFNAVIVELARTAEKKFKEPLENAMQAWKSAFLKEPRNFNGLRHAVMAKDGQVFDPATMCQWSTKAG